MRVLFLRLFKSVVPHQPQNVSLETPHLSFSCTRFRLSASEIDIWQQFLEPSLGPPPTHLYSYAGGQLLVSRAKLRRVPRVLWGQLLKLVLSTSASGDVAAAFMPHLWGALMGEPFQREWPAGNVSIDHTNSVNASSAAPLDAVPKDGAWRPRFVPYGAGSPSVAAPLSQLCRHICRRAADAEVNAMFECDRVGGWGAGGGMLPLEPPTMFATSEHDAQALARAPTRPSRVERASGCGSNSLVCAAVAAHKEDLSWLRGDASL